MPIIVHHGNAGTLAQSQDLRQSMQGMAGTFQKGRALDQRDRALDQYDRRQDFTEQAYMDELAEANARLELEEKQRQAGAQAAGLGLEGLQATRSGEMDEAVEWTADAQGQANLMKFGVLAALGGNPQLGNPKSELGLTPGRDFREVFDQRALKLIQDPNLSDEARAQLLADMDEMQAIEIREAEVAHLTQKMGRMVAAMPELDTSGIEQAIQMVQDGAAGGKEVTEAMDEASEKYIFDQKMGALSMKWGAALSPDSGVDHDDPANQKRLSDVYRTLTTARQGDDLRPAMVTLKSLLKEPIEPSELDAFGEDRARKAQSQQQGAATSEASTLSGAPFESFVQEHLSTVDEPEGAFDKAENKIDKLQGALEEAINDAPEEADLDAVIGTVLGKFGLSASREQVEWIMSGGHRDLRKKAAAEKKRAEKEKKKRSAATHRRADPGAPLN